ncbi:DUF3244 domain-containing protein [Spirosoma taeanense]|uniref:DUF3244 domain-containing protein n=1 Tax=Spirosoma taeanense TaxID=2735870 RepID=A0A6M5YD96_9BACT|nr:DUF3244 domain-containing protein [Spirosoma taeanense]QJW90932.1 DUF3244 domain-containing protein [Spirosoma taeanense]
MLPLMTNLVTSLLLSSAMLLEPTTPKALSFDASAFVTINNQIRLSVAKTAEVPVVVTLRNENKEVLYRQTISKKQVKSAILFTVNDLSDGQYELEISSSEGSIRKQVTLKTAEMKAPARVIAMQ